jgi:succinate dehydrogenase / fumarate reductase iron-sulfur subunit
MNLTLKIWRQKNAQAKGTFVTYKMDEVSPEM